MVAFFRGGFMKLYEVDESYINYLKLFDNRVLNYSGENYTKTRKYIGVLLKVNNCDYLAPLSSPNKKNDYTNRKIRKSNNFIIRIIDKQRNILLGTIKISNMIPIFDKTVIKYYDIHKETDESYKKLILKELRFIYANKEKIKKTAIKLYNQKIHNMSMDYIKHTIEFLLLEEKAKLYKK